MLTLISLSGSLRRGSRNTAMLRTARSLMPEGSRRIMEGQTRCGLEKFLQRFVAFASARKAAH